MSHAKRKADNDNNVRMSPNSPYGHRAAQSKHQKNRKAPVGQPWIWQTLEMLAHPSHQLLDLPARRVLNRIIIEQLKHAGQENGRLIVTYDNFAAHGVRRQSITHAVRLLEVAGFIRVTRGGYRQGERRPSKYTLTWLDVDLLPPTNDWKNVKIETVKAEITIAKRSRSRHLNLRERHAPILVASR